MAITVHPQCLHSPQPARLHRVLFPQGLVIGLVERTLAADVGRNNSRRRTGRGPFEDGLEHALQRVFQLTGVGGVIVVVRNTVRTGAAGGVDPAVPFLDQVGGLAAVGVDESTPLGGIPERILEQFGTGSAQAVDFFGRTCISPVTRALGT